MGRTITSDKVNGTEVYGTGNDHIGTIDHLVIDKQSGKVAYAVMSFGGFLGLGDSHYPVPWNALQYDTSLDGYRTNISEEQLKTAPAHSDHSYEDRTWETRVHDNYHTPYYW